MRRAVAIVMALIFTASACSSGPSDPSVAQVPGASFPTPDPTGSAAPGASAPPSGSGSAGTMTVLPADIVTAVDRIFDASSDGERTEATAAVLASVGVPVSGDEAAAAETHAGIVLAPEEVEIMATEASDRDQHRSTLAEFAEAFGGMSLLPPNDGLAAGLADDWLETAEPEPELYTETRTELETSTLASRMATVVNGWVTSAIEHHASADADLVELTNAPLLLAELARRRARPVDLTRPFSANDLRLGWLEITVLTAGLRGMLVGAEAAGIAATPASGVGSIVLAARQEGPPDWPASNGAPTPCDNLKQMLDSRVPLASTVINGFVGDQIKGFIQNFVNALFGEASAFAQSVGRAFKVLSIMFRVQALIMIYSEARAKVELDPDSYHRPDGNRERQGAVVTAGIPDAAWEAAQQARQLSPFATALRTCARFLGLPAWQDLVDIGEVVDDWKVQWRLVRGGQHVEIPAADQFTSGRLERPLTPENDHSGVDAIDYDVLPERREDHPGTEETDEVEFCAEVYPKAPPSGFSTILSAGTAGAALASGGYLGLVGVIANLLTGWVSSVVAIEGCGVATVSYHVATPGAWHGTVTANTERQDSSSATVTTNDGPPWGTSVSTRTSRTSVDVTDRFFLGGTDEQVDMGYIALDGRQYTNGAATDESHGTTVNAWTGSGCNYNFKEDTVSGGGWSFDVEARGTISLYPDGRYTISFNGGGWDEDINVPGEHVEQVTPLNDCLDAGSGTEEAGFHPTPTVGSGTTNSVEGQLDREDPGNVLRGSMTITNYDLSVTTITWNIVHEGPIRLPFQ